MAIGTLPLGPYNLEELHFGWTSFGGQVTQAAFPKSVVLCVAVAKFNQIVLITAWCLFGHNLHSVRIIALASKMVLETAAARSYESDQKAAFGSPSAC